MLITKYRQQAVSWAVIEKKMVFFQPSLPRILGNRRRVTSSPIRKILDTSPETAFEAPKLPAYSETVVIII